MSKPWAAIVDLERERDRYHKLAKSNASSSVGDLGPVILAVAGIELRDQLEEAEALLCDLGLVRVRIETEPGQGTLCPSEQED